MATRDILTLDTVLAPRLVRMLYGLALILIALCVIFGLVRGITIMTRTSIMPRPGIMMSTTSPTPPPSGAHMMPDARMPGAMTGMHSRHWDFQRGFDRRRMAMHRQPLLFGAVIIVRTLVLGAIALMVVRILAELGLVILAMPKRPES